MNGWKKLLVLGFALVIILPLIGLSGCEAGEHWARGYELYKADKYAEAVVEFSKTIELNPNHPDAHYYRGVCYVYMKEYDLAIADLSVAIGRDAEDPYAYYYRGAAYARNGRSDLAIADFNKAIQFSDKASLTQSANKEIARLGPTTSTGNGGSTSTCTPGSALCQLTCIGKAGLQEAPGGCWCDCDDPRNKTSDFN